MSQRCIIRFTQMPMHKTKVILAIGQNGMVFLRRRIINELGNLAWSNWFYDEELTRLIKTKISEKIPNYKGPYTREQLSPILDQSYEKKLWIGLSTYPPQLVKLEMTHVLDFMPGKYVLPSSITDSKKNK